VKARRRQLQVRATAGGQPPGGDPRNRRRQQQHRVEVGVVDDAPAGLHQGHAQRSGDVAPPVAVDLVVARPEALERRDGDEQRTAGDRHPQQLAQGAHVVVEVLDDIEAGDEVEARAAPREALDARQPDPRPRFGPRAPHRGRVVVDAPDGAELRQLAHGATGAAARIEDRAVGRQPETLGKPEHDPAAPPVPPVGLVVREHRVALGGQHGTTVAPRRLGPAAAPLAFG
jgi:hypothetical protein